MNPQDREPLKRSDHHHDGDPGLGRTDAALRRIGDALHGLKYGSVLAIVQDGVVVQIERTEKTRFGK
jgi:hypothetical protein